jgi:hypothetical protein
MHLLTLLQAATATIAGGDFTTAAVAFTGFVLAGFWREINVFKREVLKWQSKIDTTLFGATGDNGINGTVKDHEKRIRRLEDGDA